MPPGTPWAEGAFSKAERDALLARMREVEATIWPGESGPPPNRTERASLMDTLYALRGEYADRLPRVVMSACPFTGVPFRHSIDPYGVDGPWWRKVRAFTPEEAAPPPTFRVLLGALDLRGRVPSEVGDLVLAGPDVPYVVPRLLELPGMVAVISRLELATGDLAYPIAYFSTEDVHPSRLHQTWTRADLWFTTPDGKSGWAAKNDPWDFDLGPWIERGSVRWIAPGDEAVRVVKGGGGSGVECPFAGLPGDRQPQYLSGGQRELGELPSGEPMMPFEE